ncbi:MAG: aminoglycoside phosphotransferase family protein [Chloroflexota bacterium]
MTKISTGRTPSRIAPLGCGATSAAWHVQIGRNAVIIRMIPLGTPRPVTYQSEFTVLRLLREKGCPVPNPVMNSLECRDKLTNIPEPWSVTEVVKGQAVKGNRLSKVTAREVGEVLASLHSLPVIQYGRLAEQPKGVVGLQGDHVSGIRARWCWANIWPFDNSHLAEHPLADFDINIAARLKDLKPAIIQAATQDPVALIHSDLHGEHIFEQDGKLTGIIDFGTSFIGTPAWDFAVMAYYHGWDTLEIVLTGYTCSSRVQYYQFKQAQRLAAAVSLYKLAKGIEAQKSRKKLTQIGSFLEQTVHELDKIT